MYYDFSSLINLAILTSEKKRKHLENLFLLLNFLLKFVIWLTFILKEIVDVTEEYNRDRRDLELTQEELLKELKLKYLIIENFIPVEEKEKILARARYDEEEDVWKLGGSRPASGS